MKEKDLQAGIYDVIIIGGGIAGLTAGLYAGRYRMRTLLIAKEVGGEGITAGATSNYPGFLKIDGFDLMMKIKEQVDALSVPIHSGAVTKIERKGHCFIVETESETFTSSTVIFATGSKHRPLGLPREDELKGRGIHYCVTCDGPLYKDKTIALVGGGDSSVKGINLIAEYVSKAYLIVREKELIAEPINLEQLKKLGDKVEVLYETEVTEFIGKDRIEGVRLSRPVHGSDALAIDGLFVEIGAIPNTELPKMIDVALDDRGYITVDDGMRTNIDGVFAAGDTVNHFGRFKQYITGAALGAVAATSAYDDVKKHGNLCDLHAIPEKVDSQSV